MDATVDLYKDKEGGYFRAARLDLLRLLPQGGGLRLLDLGAGDGATLRAAKEMGLASYTVGIELMAPAGGAPGVDRFLQGNVEAMELDLPAGGFDAVLCADVLEHLVDPWRVVSRLADLLRPGGVLLSSIPNVRNHRVLRPLVLRGDFRYQPAGLMDRSHLRFFCRRNIREMFEGAGLTVEAMEENMGGYGLKHRLVDRLSFGLLHDLFVFQFLTRARKP
ncbi:MAG TPA: methyltransferase domain-containing protein [Thermoanaerobaculia bacterium]|nr:methyltransferase domain-containing protein [Thermoanaerobaculia bacterium]